MNADKTAPCFVIITGPRTVFIPFHRFISGNEAYTNDRPTKNKQEDRKSVQLKTIKTQKTQNTQ